LRHSFPPSSVICTTRRLLRHDETLEQATVEGRNRASVVVAWLNATESVGQTCP
jgi:hypothetical protein